MQNFDIFITYVSWGADGKTRPVIVVEVQENDVLYYNITTQYENKSENIRSKYFPISDWNSAGLRKISYIDTNDIYIVEKEVIESSCLIGHLTNRDLKAFAEFLAQQD